MIASQGSGLRFWGSDVGFRGTGMGFQAEDLGVWGLGSQAFRV